jgi:hypothetical protein
MEEGRMSYDHWKTIEPDDGEERPARGTELELLYADFQRLRASHDRLLNAARDFVIDNRLAMQDHTYQLDLRIHLEAFQAAIADAEEREI